MTMAWLTMMAMGQLANIQAELEALQGKSTKRSRWLALFLAGSGALGAVVELVAAMTGAAP